MHKKLMLMFIASDDSLWHQFISTPGQRAYVTRGQESAAEWANNKGAKNA